MTEDNQFLVNSKAEYIKFANDHILNRYALGKMTDTQYLTHIRKHWGEPPSYPAFVWTFVTEAAEEVGPTFPQTHVRWETKAELLQRLARFDV